MLATLNLRGYKLTCSVSHRIVVHREGSQLSWAPEDCWLFLGQPLSYNDELSRGVKNGMFGIKLRVRIWSTGSTPLPPSPEAVLDCGYGRPIAKSRTPDIRNVFNILTPTSFRFQEIRIIWKGGYSPMPHFSQFWLLRGYNFLNSSQRVTSLYNYWVFLTPRILIIINENHRLIPWILLIFLSMPCG